MTIKKRVLSLFPLLNKNLTYDKGRCSMDEEYKKFEQELIIELYRKGEKHTVIAKCIQRERKNFKLKNTDITDCMVTVEQTIFNKQHRRNKDELGKET
jgi:hypothetical protein